jgi:hypothetical protein
MKRLSDCLLLMFICAALLFNISAPAAFAAEPFENINFPRNLQSYSDNQKSGIIDILVDRAQQEPFNLAATLIFFAAIVHTFLSTKFLSIAHKWEHAHEEKKKQGQVSRHSVHHGAELFHFLGEIEVVFGVWAIALIGAILVYFDWPTTVNYICYKVNFTEPMFVVVIMTLAATRPILYASEAVMRKIADLMGGSLKAWWLTILTLGAILGSFITEPAAMTISALLLSRQFYELEPSEKFKYATIGLLFVNISVGGTLTHFAAPPVLMVVGPWQWDTAYMLTHFGWKAVLGIFMATGVYFWAFRSELSTLEEKFAVKMLKKEIRERYLKREELESTLDRIIPEIDQELGFREMLDRKIQTVVGKAKAHLIAQYMNRVAEKGIDPDLARLAFEQRFDEITLSRMRRAIPMLLPEDQHAAFIDPEWDRREDPVPLWVVLIHILFMGWTIFNAHHPEMFVPGLLFFLGFWQITAPYQNRVDLKSPLLVGLFLGGLVIHGGVQGWWIEPVLGSLPKLPLMLSATVLTAFNDNAAITFLSTLVPGFTESLKYAVVAGAVTGGGLTVIANAPNPAGQSLLKTHFTDGVSPAGLFKAALIPTIIMFMMFLVPTP